METVATIFASSRIVYMILVPVLRELAGVLLAIAISKDCKARDNGSGALWGLVTVFLPAFSGLIYMIYSRFMVNRKPKSENDRKQVNTAHKLTFWAIIVYILALIIALVCIITTAASGLSLLVADNTATLFI